MTTPSVSRARCHIDDCTEPAYYKARLDWTNQPEVLLCIGHAAAESRAVSVVTITNRVRQNQPEVSS